MEKSRFTDMQGVINGKAVQLMNNEEALIKFMTDKTPEQKRQTRIHLKTVKWLRGKK